MTENEKNPEDVTLADVGAAVLDGIKTGWQQSSETLAHDHGITPGKAAVELAESIILMRLMWRAAKRGDVAVTIAWASVRLAVGANHRARRQRVLSERQMDVLIDRAVR